MVVLADLAEARAEGFRVTLEGEGCAVAGTSGAFVGYDCSDCCCR